MKVFSRFWTFFSRWRLSATILSNLNPVFMKDILHYSPNVTRKKHNLYIHTQNTAKFGNKILRAFGANIWNTSPEYIKSTTSLLELKKFIKTRPRPKYKCSVCKREWNFHIFRYAQHFSKMNSERCQVYEVELFVKTVNDLKRLKTVIAKRSTLGIRWGSEHTSSFAKLCIRKRAVLGVDPLHKNGFKFLVYFLLVF